MSKIIKVNLKWGKQKFENIELNLDEPPSIFKGQVYTLTGVLPERQKIMIKGGILKDDSDWNKLNIQNGYTFMMMGSVETDIPKEPETKTIFMEDLSSDQVLSLEVQKIIYYYY
jgi:ubiquitin carboxyl-terminal hydrolase 14